MNSTILALLKKSAATMLAPYRYEMLRHAIAHKRIPSLEHPTTFNDKIGHRKLFTHDPLYPIVANKWQVRDFVTRRVGAEYLPEVYFCGDDSEAVRLNTLPSSFVMKATHGSGPEFIRFFHDKQAVSDQNVKAAVHQLLQQQYGYLTNETWYTQMQPQIMLEEMLQDNSYSVPLDYKFFVFSGVVAFIQVDYARFQQHTRTLYSPDWKAQNVTYKYPQGPVSPKPQSLTQMIKVAEALAQGFDFVRIDLYCVNDQRILFGEMTLAPEAGWGRFHPRTWDEQLGELWLNKDDDTSL
jgi:hypothetical protein